MQVAAKSYLTAGAALVGASAIAVAPIQVAPPDIKVPAIPVSSAAIELTAVVDPITAWLNVFTGAVDNVGQITEDTLANPVPALRQLIENQLGYAQTVGTALQGVGEALVEQVTVAFPTALQDAFGELSQGNIAEATYIMSQAFANAVLTVGISLALPFGDAVLNIPTKIAENLTNVVTSLTSLQTLVGILPAALGLPFGAVNAFADSVQVAINAVGAGDPLEAVTALVNIPANVTGAFLNGYTQQFGGTYFPGIFSPVDSPVGIGLIAFALNSLPQTIAEALGASPLSSLFRQQQPAESVDETAAPAADESSVAGQELTGASGVPDLNAQAVNLNLGSPAPTGAALGEDDDGEEGAEAGLESPEGDLKSPEGDLKTEETGEEGDADEGADADQEGKTPNGGDDLSNGNKTESGAGDNESKTSDSSTKDPVNDTSEKPGAEAGVGGTDGDSNGDGAGGDGDGDDDGDGGSNSGGSGGGSGGGE